MIGDALLLAEPHFDVDGRGARLRDCIGDEDRFMTLGDWILDAVAASANPALRPAQDILRRLKRRDLYRVLASATLAPLAVLTPAAVKEAVLREVTDVNHRAALSELLIADIIHVTPAKHAGDAPLANIPFVRTRDAATSVDLQPLKIAGGASPPRRSHPRITATAPFLASCVRRGMASSEELATVAAGRWRLGREGCAGRACWSRRALCHTATKTCWFSWNKPLLCRPSSRPRGERPNFVSFHCRRPRRTKDGALSSAAVAHLFDCGS
jgi:hypothetical protein